MAPTLSILDSPLYWHPPGYYSLRGLVTTETEVRSAATVQGPCKILFTPLLSAHRLFSLFLLLATPAFKSNSSLTFLDGLPPGSASPLSYYLPSAMPRYWLSSRKRTSIGSGFQDCFSVLFQAQTVSFSVYFLKCRTHKLSIAAKQINLRL